MMVAIAVMIGSFRETVIYWVGQTLQADLFIATGRRVEPRRAARPSRRTLERIVAAHPASWRRRSLPERRRSPYDGRLIVLGAGDFRRPARARARCCSRRPPTARAAMRARDRHTTPSSSPRAFALKRRRRRGRQRSTLPTPHGPRPFRVAAVYYDYSTDRGVVADGSRDVHARTTASCGRRACPSTCAPGATPKRSATICCGALGERAPRLHPHQPDAARRGAADLRQHVRDHLRARGHRDPRRDAWASAARCSR